MSRGGYRGYIASRPLRGVTYPQRVQNLVVRDYAARHGLPYLLSLTEYAMHDSFMMLERLLAELPQLDGAIFFSLFMLPPLAQRRREVYRRFLATGAVLHAALENRSLTSADDVEGFEQLILVASALARAPFGGRYEKDGVGHAARTAGEARLLALVSPAE